MIPPRGSPICTQIQCKTLILLHWRVDEGHSSPLSWSINWPLTMGHWKQIPSHLFSVCGTIPTTMHVKAINQCIWITNTKHVCKNHNWLVRKCKTSSTLFYEQRFWRSERWRGLAQSYTLTSRRAGIRINLLPSKEGTRTLILFMPTQWLKDNTYATLTIIMARWQVPTKISKESFGSIRNEKWLKKTKTMHK